jgi:Icc-related predicted phosphoesterase/uncharacterized protein YprB with RNaseH-like and TPR domain
MRIMAFSDWRIQRVDKLIEFIEELHKRLDIIVYAGDDIVRFNKISIKKIPEPLKEIYLTSGGRPSENYFEKLAMLSRYGLVAVAGNDDSPFVKSVISGKNVYNIHEKPLVLGDYAFIGLEGSTSGPGVLIYNEKEVETHLNKMLEKVPNKKLIIVSHTPPYGILDIGIRFGIEHIGSHSLREFIDAHSEKIKLLFCGHAHSQGGKDETYDNITILNCASHDNEGEPGKVALVEVGDKTLIMWNLIYDWGRIDKEMQNLMDIPLVGDSRAKAFIDIGIKTIEQVAKINPLDPAFRRYNCFSASSLELIKNYAEAIVKDKIIVKGKHPFFNSGKKIYFFDAEYNPTGTKIGPYGIFLIGIMDENGKVTQHFLDDPQNEKMMLKQFRKWLVREKPVIVSYSSTSADKPQLLNAFVRLKIPIKEVENAFFDLYYDCINTQRTETQSVFLPMRGSMSLKDVATYLGYKQPVDLKIFDGLQALIAYEEYLRTKKESLKLDLLRYNRIDLERTKFIFDKIHESIKCAAGYLRSTNHELMSGIVDSLK